MKQCAWTSESIRSQLLRNRNVFSLHRLLEIRARFAKYLSKTHLCVYGSLNSLYLLPFCCSYLRWPYKTCATKNPTSLAGSQRRDLATQAILTLKPLELSEPYSKQLLTLYALSWLYWHYCRDTITWRLSRTRLSVLDGPLQNCG